MIGLCLVIAAAACGGSGESFLTVINGVTGADTVRPFVLSVNPANGATDVPTNAVVTITFSELVDSATVTNTAFTLIPGITGTIVVNGAVATLTPTPALPLNTQIVGSVIGVKDRRGNAMAAAYAFTFRTVQ
jgi:hypothetical protein